MFFGISVKYYKRVVWLPTHTHTHPHPPTPPHTHTKAEKTVTTFAFSSLSILYCTVYTLYTVHLCTVHRKKNIGENWIFNEYLLMGWITSRITLRCQQYMTFTSPHQKIFIENSIQFSDSVFFRPNASFAETLVSFAAFLVLEV